MATKSWQWIPLVAVLAVSAALIGTIAVATANQTRSTLQSLSWNNYRMTPNFARFDEPRTAADEPPEYLVEHWVPEEAFSMVPDSFQLLGESEGVSYWVARDGKDNVCFMLSAPEAGSEGGCNSVGQFNRSGVGLGFSGVPDRVILIAYLVPDRALPEQAVGLDSPFPGVVTVPEGTRKGEVLEVPVSSGAPIQIHVFR